MFVISLLDTVSVVVPELDIPDPKIFLWIPASAADALVVNPNGISTLIAWINSWSMAI